MPFWNKKPNDLDTDVAITWSMYASKCFDSKCNEEELLILKEIEAIETKQILPYILFSKKENERIPVKMIKYELQKEKIGRFRTKEHPIIQFGISNIDENGEINTKIYDIPLKDELKQKLQLQPKQKLNISTLNQICKQIDENYDQYKSFIDRKEVKGQMELDY